METIGITRKIDELGRVVLPIELRQKFGLRTGGSVEIYTDEKGIVLKPVPARSCVFCDSEDDLHQYANKDLCASCIKKIKTLNLGDESVD